MFRYSIFLIFFFIFISSNQAQLLQNNLNKEVRGVWIATVNNIDWPSKNNLSVEEQKKEFIKLVQFHKKNGLNTLIVQIRPCGDAFYPNRYEPWSEYLTGKQGVPPNPFYDPMAFMIEETHKQGMEFHAWLNPYRVLFKVGTSSLAPSHICFLHPEWFLVYGDKKYFNPGIPAVWDYTCMIVKNIIETYNVDAIHMDDYFYPYRIEGKEFEDNNTYLQNTRGLNKDDWRRSNCDTIIKRIYTTIKSVNPQIKFGISPFGVWRNQSADSINGSKTQAGQTNYDDLYADILLWLKNGWVDYVVPQLYWEKGHNKADFDVLLPWWNTHNYGKDVYIGHGLYRALPVENKLPLWKNKNELFNQLIDIKKLPTIKGSVLFSSKSVENMRSDWLDTFRNTFYYEPALIPTMDYLPNIYISKAVVINQQDEFKISYNGNEKIKGFILASTNLIDTNKITIEQIFNNVKEIKIPYTLLNQVPKKWYIFVLGRWNHISDGVALIK